MDRDRLTPDYAALHPGYKPATRLPLLKDEDHHVPQHQDPA